MTWQILQTRRFSRVYKKLTNATLIADTDDAVVEVANNPDVGERKKGDLGQLWVHKFRSQGQLYLLGYTREDEVRLIYLEALGPLEMLPFTPPIPLPPVPQHYLHPWG